MIRTSLLLAINLFVQTGPTTDLPAIERFQVGPVVVGADAQKVYEAFLNRRELVDLGSEGMLSPALLLRFEGATQRDGIVAELVPRQSGLIVWRIEIRDPAFKSAKGIGVGSTVGQLRAAYRLGNVFSGEGSVVIRVEELSASFALDQTGPGGSDLWRVRDPARVPDSVKIIAILLTR